jgi:hypothetical protein
MLRNTIEEVAFDAGASTPEAPIGEVAMLSIAISLKRIADVLDGTTLGLCATETIFNPQTVQNRDVRNNY